MFLGCRRSNDGFVVHARLDRIIDHDGRLPAAVATRSSLRHRRCVAQAFVHPWRVLAVAVATQYLVERPHWRRIRCFVACITGVGRVGHRTQRPGHRNRRLIILVPGLM